LTWMQQTRVRVLWVIVGIGLTTLGVLSLTTIPAWPIVGVAVATVALAISRMTSRLSQPICLGCGHDLSGQPLGEHGTICPECGAVHQQLARSDDADGPDSGEERI
jgi:hypothetical protein